MGQEKAPSVPAMPSAGKNLESWIKSWTKSGDSIYGAQDADLQKQLDYIDTASPEYLALEKQYGPEYAKVFQSLAKSMISSGVDLQGEMGGKVIDQQDALDRQNQTALASRAADLGGSYDALLSDPETEAIRQAMAAKGLDFANASTFGPSDETAALRKTVYDQMQQELMAGTGLDPELQRSIEQGIRSSQISRGLTKGSAPVSAEAYALGDTGLQMRQQRQQNALGMAGTLDQVGQQNLTTAQSLAKLNEALRPRGSEYVLGMPSYDANGALLAAGNLSSTGAQAPLSAAQGLISNSQPEVNFATMTGWGLPYTANANTQNTKNKYNYGVAQAQATNAQRQQTSSAMMNMGMPGGIGTSIAGGAQGAGGASQGYMYL
jgi:hypothetical protein